jgi:tetratricopeptide (TPR) repeat protein
MKRFLPKHTWTQAVLLGVLLLLFAPVPTQAQVDSLFDKANIYYKNSDYEKAANYYKKIMEQGQVSAALYYNMGNTFFKMNRLAPAILYYEKAKVLAPNDEDIQYNLDLANGMVTDKIEPLPQFFLKRWYQNIVRSFHSDTWAFISLLLFLILLISLAIYLYSARLIWKKGGFWIAVFTILLFTFALTSSITQKNVLEAKDKAIIFSKSVTIKSSPRDTGTELFVLHEGTKVSLLSEDGEWREIKLRDGSKGWLRAEAIEII